MNRKSVFLLFIAAISLMACQKSFKASTAQVFKSVDEAIGCNGFQETFFDSLVELKLQKQELPSVSDLQNTLENLEAKLKLKKLSHLKRKELALRISQLYQSITENNQPSLETLAAIELGNISTPEEKLRQKNIAQSLSEINEFAKLEMDNSDDCPADNRRQPVPPSGLLGSWKSQRDPAVYGALKTFVVSYQSCDAGLTDIIDDTTADIRGVAVVGTHPSGRGKIRVIDNLDAFLKSHHYLKNYRQPNNTCFAITKRPMIYDFGGKPWTSTNINAPFDLFQDAGTGSKELGLDCSGYVYTALATSGLKLKSSLKLKATTVHGVSAASLKNPEDFGFDCLDHVDFSGMDSLKPGDLIATSGHVVMVEDIGEDPFGISKVQNVQGCVLQAMSTERFSFSVLHSSPAKGAIGIAKMKASSYFSEGGTMAYGLLEHAVNACKAKFGKTISSHSDDASIVRHKKTFECVGTPIPLARESCVANCPTN